MSGPCRSISSGRMMRHRVLSAHDTAPAGSGARSSRLAAGRGRCLPAGPSYSAATEMLEAHSHIGVLMCAIEPLLQLPHAFRHPLDVTADVEQPLVWCDAPCRYRNCDPPPARQLRG